MKTATNAWASYAGGLLQWDYTPKEIWQEGFDACYEEVKEYQGRIDDAKRSQIFRDEEEPHISWANTTFKAIWCKGYVAAEMEYRIRLAAQLAPQGNDELTAAFHTGFQAALKLVDAGQI